MPGVKTAISLDERLFIRVNKLADEMHVSRSRLFSLAVSDYLKKWENQAILDQLNRAHGNSPNAEDENVSKHMRNNHKRIVEQESW